MASRAGYSGEPRPPRCAVFSALAGNTSDVVAGAATTAREARALPTLLNVPILKCWPLDGGRFITRCRASSRAIRDTGERNLGMYRIQIYDDKTTGMHWQLQKSPLATAVAITKRASGCPSLFSSAVTRCFPSPPSAPMPDGLDEFLLAGYLRKKIRRDDKVRTNDLEVPANADFIIEG